MFGALLYMALRPGTKKIEDEVFGELWSVVLKEDDGIKMARESN